MMTAKHAFWVSLLLLIRGAVPWTGSAESRNAEPAESTPPTTASRQEDSKAADREAQPIQPTSPATTRADTPPKDARGETSPETEAAKAKGGAPSVISPALPRPYNLGPLPKGQKAFLKHAVYELDEEDCSMCHKNVDPKNPGPILKPVNELCLECHEAVKDALNLKFPHAPALDRCSICHNPHESMQPALLVEESSALCLGCHEAIQDLITQSQVVHGALTKDKKCVNCHNPHGSDTEHILQGLPFDLCVKCHSTSTLKDREGRPLTNFKALLDENPEWHAPVAAKDCSACHNPHAGPHFRMLIDEYPPKFYSPYDPKLYALCFECHNREMVEEPQTTTVTQFRDGSKNLHYVHVNKPSRGRTCRACHEVHAAKQRHIIRDGVPYGSRGWILQLNYTATPTGGSCERTCHQKRSYNYTMPAASPPASGLATTGAHATNSPPPSTKAAANEQPNQGSKPSEPQPEPSNP